MKIKSYLIINVKIVMGHFSEQVHISIGSFTQNVVYHNLELSQKMADHHHFSFVWQYTCKAIKSGRSGKGTADVSWR